MALTDDEILSAAGRVRAAKRRQVVKACAVCGTPFVGIAQRRYCSDACRVRASRRRVGGTDGDRRPPALATGGAMATTEATAVTTENVPRRTDDDPIRALLRAQGHLDDEHEPPPAPRGESEPLIDYLERVSDYVTGGRILTESSAELLRQAREERDAQLLVATGLDPDPVDEE